MGIVRPEVWYGLFWLLAGTGFLVALYWVIRWAVIAALRSR